MSENREGKLYLKKKSFIFVWIKKLLNISSLVIFGSLSNFIFNIGFLLQKMLMSMSAFV
jgi:hypothetical protein